MNIEEIENQIINADCMDILKQLPDKCIDLVLTDPPYELDLQGGKGTEGLLGRATKSAKNDIENLSQGFNYNEVFYEFKRVCKKLNVYIFCSNKQIPKIMSYFDKDYIVNLLVWYKPNAIPLSNGTYHSNLEFIICVREKGATFNNLSLNQMSKLINIPMENCKRLHPTQKPIRLFERLLNIKSNENDLILDCFSGSGTTAVACHNLKRRFICIEKDYDYWKASVERYNNAKAQLKLF